MSASQLLSHLSFFVMAKAFVYFKMKTVEEQRPTEHLLFYWKEPPNFVLDKKYTAFKYRNVSYFSLSIIYRYTAKTELLISV